MRVLLLVALVFPGTVLGQALPTRARSGAVPTVLPAGPASAPSGSNVERLDPNAPRTDDMPAPVVQLSEPAPTSVKLSWNAIVGASGYVVYRNDLGVLTAPPLPLTTTSYTHWAANDYRLTYTYRVVAQYPNGHTGPSATLSYTPQKPPRLESFEADIVENDIVLYWTLGSEFGSADPHHFLLLGPGLGDGAIVPGNKSRYQFTPEGVRGHLFYAAAAVFEPGPVMAPAAEWARADLFYPVGKYRVTIVGFSAEETTSDDSWHRDGKGDEIFIAGAVHSYSRHLGQITKMTVARTRVYGDINGNAARIRTGGMSNTGGIQAGDQVLTAVTPPGVPPDSAIPLRIFEGELYPDDILVIRPAVFESDRDEGAKNDAYDEWRRIMTTRDMGTNPNSTYWPASHELSNPAILQDLKHLESGGVKTGFQLWAQSSQNQRIGDDRVITFDIAKIERFFAHNLGTQFEFRGGTGGAYSQGGRYILRMKIERVP